MARPCNGILLGIPVYNEQAYVTRVLSEVRDYADCVLVIDDGSMDDTPLLLAQQRFQPLHVGVGLDPGTDPGRLAYRLGGALELHPHTRHLPRQSSTCQLFARSLPPPSRTNYVRPGLKNKKNKESTVTPRRCRATMGAFTRPRQAAASPRGHGAGRH